MTISTDDTKEMKLRIWIFGDKLAILYAIFEFRRVPVRASRTLHPKLYLKNNNIQYERGSNPEVESTAFETGWNLDQNLVVLKLDLQLQKSVFPFIALKYTVSIDS